MSQVELSIEERVAQTFPGILVSAVAATIPRELPIGLIEQQLACEVEKAAEDLAGYGLLSEHPSIRIWREAYRAMKVKPSKYRSSIESLLRRVQKRQDLSTWIPLVDLYNGVSIVTRAPIGGYDIDKLHQAAVTLRFARFEAATRSAVFFSETTANNQESNPIDALRQLRRVATEMGALCGPITSISASNRHAVVLLPLQAERR